MAANWKLGFSILSLLCCTELAAATFVAGSFRSPEKGGAFHSLLTALSMSPNGGNDESQASLLVSNINHLGNDGSGDSNKIRLVLASQSPRRREILDMMGLAGRYTTIPSPLDEALLQTRLGNQSISPEHYTRTLAEEKAKALAAAMLQQRQQQQGQHLILGSDTIVDLEGNILEKPATADEARTMLQSLSGKWHKVHTGVAIYHVDGDSFDLVSSFTDTARVRFAPLSLKDIDAYVNTGEPMDKAGSYGIQGVGGQLVECIEGDFFTVMGLPMHRVSKDISRAISQVPKNR